MSLSDKFTERLITLLRNIRLFGIAKQACEYLINIYFCIIDASQKSDDIGLVDTCRR